MGILAKTPHKRYLRIPGGEVQYGRLTHRLGIWFRGRYYTILCGRWPETGEKLQRGPKRPWGKP